MGAPQHPTAMSTTARAAQAAVMPVGFYLPAAGIVAGLLAVDIRLYSPSAGSTGPSWCTSPAWPPAARPPGSFARCSRPPGGRAPSPERWTRSTPGGPASSPTARPGAPRPELATGRAAREFQRPVLRTALADLTTVAAITPQHS